MRKAALIAVILVFTGYCAICQPANDKAIMVFTNYGLVLPTNDFVKGVNNKGYAIRNFADFSVRYEIQTEGSRKWHSDYGFPAYGAGLYLIDFKDRGLLKTPIAAYGFMGFNYLQTKHFYLRGEFALGLALHWNHFSKTNPLNTAITTPLTCYFDYGIHLYYRTKSRLDIGLGFSFSHFSNGAVQKPNNGINMFAPRLSLKYNNKRKLQQEPVSFSPNSVSPDGNQTKKIYYLITMYGGVFGYYHCFEGYNLSDSILTADNVIGGLSAATIYNFNAKYGLGLGLDLAYLGMSGRGCEVRNGKVIITDDFNGWQRLNMSVFVAFEYRIKRLSINLEPGVYLNKRKPDMINPMFDVPVFYQRIGLRYQATKHLFCGLKLRVYNFGNANFVEWNIGLRF